MDERLDGISTIDLLKVIEEKHPNLSKIPVICDNASYYRSKAVKAYFETSRIELIFLPPYSPNLNLIERLWRFMKRDKLHNIYYPAFAEFKAAIEDFFRELGSHKAELRTLACGKFPNHRC